MHALTNKAYIYAHIRDSAADIAPPFRRTPPAILHTSLEFSRGQRSVNASVSEPVSSGSALNWVHSCGVEATLAISGRLFGVTKKVHNETHKHTRIHTHTHTNNDTSTRNLSTKRNVCTDVRCQNAAGSKSFSRLCKHSKFRLFSSISAVRGTYRDAKRAAQDYYQAQAALHALPAFSDWPKRPAEWEAFEATDET